MSEDDKTRRVEKMPPLILQGTPSNAQRDAQTITFRTQSDGTMREWTLLVGQAPDGSERNLVTDDIGLLRNRPYEPYVTEAFDVVTTGFGTVYTVPAGVVAKVWFTITNILVNEVAVSLSVGGAVILPVGATPRVPLPPDGPGVSGGPYTLAVGETIQHRCDTVNGAHIRVEIEEYGLGDTP